MRKIIITTITLLVISINNTNAQAVWGGRIGLSHYTETLSANIEDFSSSNKAEFFGIELGPVMYYSFTNRLYLNTGATLGIIFPVEDMLRDSYQLFHVDIPLYLGFSAPIGNNLSLFAQAGPYVGYWTSTDEFTNDILNPFQAGIGLMAGINIKRFKFEFGYKHGLTDLSSNEGRWDNEIYILESSSKLTSLFFGISYVF